MVNLKIYLREYKTSNEGVVWFDFYVNRGRVHFSAKVRCAKKNWDPKKMRIKSSDPDHEDKNQLIENIRARINNVFVTYRLKNKKLTRDAFLRAYNRPSDYATFFDFIKANKRNLNFGNELSTINTHNVVIKKVQEWQPNLHFDDITEDWLHRYYIHLRKNCGNNDNTTGKNMAIFKKYILAAWKMGYMDENPFVNFKIKRGKASYTYLREDELKILMDAYKTGVFESKYHRTLEFFLFMCFSSLHVTDARNLSLEQFTEESFVYYRVKNRNSKPEPILVPVSETLKMIIRNVVGLRKKGKIFQDLPADQTMNRYLKDIAAELEIRKPITHKAGRHTFATYFLAKTKDITALQKILGHSSLSETMIYAHVLDESKQEGVKCFDGFAH
ncbi:site-specific integrase [Proteiniphilum sp. X52]|uniref:site-specific integrase n=1 Tax=Proteiniphilum sp. X52 TaxID=2382159 RepID=UPI000F0A1F42|nr:site-specific integrase [Proteiniphilum sp. X52]RNC65683.1 site-specific integrase [Proteiniphilum sp. X52]